MISEVIGVGTTLIVDVMYTGPPFPVLRGTPELPVAAPDVPLPPGTGKGAVPLACGG